MNHFILLFFGFAPSIIWLLFYLRKDAHPEPKTMVLKIFFYGMLITIPTAFLEQAFKLFFSNLGFFWPFPLLTLILYVFIGVALVEESFKYLVVKCKVLNNQEFDEPVDAMIYMIIAGLGFAALENILCLIPSISLSEILGISALRFVGATFLHALCSGTIGFFLALSIYEAKRKKLLMVGIILATFLHGLFNYSIIVIEGSLKIIIPSLIIILLALFVSLGFKKLKKMKSVCKI